MGVFREVGGVIEVAVGDGGGGGVVTNGRENPKPITTIPSKPTAITCIQFSLGIRSELFILNPPPRIARKTNTIPIMINRVRSPGKLIFKVVTPLHSYYVRDDSGTSKYCNRAEETEQCKVTPLTFADTLLVFICLV